MTRAIGSATLTAIEAAEAQPLYFVELRIDEASSPQVITRLHTGLGTITWGGFDWTGAGDLASIDSVKESNTINPNALRMGLSGIDSTITNMIFEVDYYMRPCLVYLGALQDGALVENPSTIFSGFISSLSMVFAGTDGDTVVLEAESELILFKRSRNVRYTSPQLQSEYSGDLGCEFLELTSTQTIVWRGKNNGLGGSGGRLSPAEGGPDRGSR